MTISTHAARRIRKGILEARNASAEMIRHEDLDRKILYTSGWDLRSLALRLTLENLSPRLKAVGIRVDFRESCVILDRDFDVAAAFWKQDQPSSWWGGWTR